LRGYMFKELSGDMAALVMAEYQLGFVSAFADGGTVHVRRVDAPEIGWARGEPGRPFPHRAAWRTDQYAHLIPEMRRSSTGPSEVDGPAAIPLRSRESRSRRAVERQSAKHMNASQPSSPSPWAPGSAALAEGPAATCTATLAGGRVLIDVELQRFLDPELLKLVRLGLEGNLQFELVLLRRGRSGSTS